MDSSFIKVDSDTCSLVMVSKLETVGGYAFSRRDAEQLTKRIRPWVKSLYAQEDSDIARCLSLEVFLDWDKQQKG